MKRISVAVSAGAMALCMQLVACTDLTENPKSLITPSTYFNTPGEALAALAGVYAQLRGTAGEGDYWGISEVSTDEMVVPTRGQDWYDNGTWMELHHQSWSATSPGTLSFMNNAWNTAFQGVARANVLIDAMAGSSLPNAAEVTTEARGLRAFYYYVLMDLFGGVPLATTSEIKPRPRETRDSIFKFIESELLAIYPDLPATWDAANNGRFTKGAADAILANMYINAGIFTKDGVPGGINATAYNSCAGIAVSGGDACQQAVVHADALISSPNYALSATYGANFTAANNTSKENIFAVKFAAATDLGFVMLQRTLHYNQFNPSPWNGFATLASAYAKFDSLDQRRKVFLVGPQVNVETNQPVTDRAGAPLVFTTSIANVNAATEGEGARIYKWPADPSHVAQNNGNDFAWFRLSEMYLIKAEAILDGATSAQTPLALVKAVRARAFPGGDTLSAVTLPVILRERLFEFAAEGKRRQDLIRFGAYTQPWEFKTNPEGQDPKRVLMPIPQGQIDVNPLITANNPGY